jgi:hypothetical protein
MIDPLYSELGIEYQQAYSGPYRPMDIKKNDGTVILALKDRRLSGYGRPSVCFGNSESVIHEFVDAYMQTPRVNYMDYMEGGKVTEITRFLMKQGRVPLIAFTQIIDLTQSEDDLHKEVRKSYQNLINKYRPEFCPVQVLRDLHFHVCGRETRNPKTWEIQDRMCKQDEGFCLKGQDSSALFLHNSEHCYYGVAASMPHAVSHPLIWYGIIEAKRRGCKTFEMGKQVFIGDSKELGIAGFKRGFGGQTIVRLEFV